MTLPLLTVEVISTRPVTVCRPNEIFQVYSEPQAIGNTVQGKDGCYPTVLATLPDVSNSLIRFVSIRAPITVRITSKLTRLAGRRVLPTSAKCQVRLKAEAKRTL
jgi:hypothetical protein